MSLLSVFVKLCLLRAFTQRANIRQSLDSVHAQENDTEASLSFNPDSSSSNNLPDPLSLAAPLGVDHTSLWNNVLRARRSGVASSSSSEGSPSSHSSFISQLDSEADAQPVEEGAVPYNPATYGLKIDALLHARSAIEQVINGQSFRP